MCFWRARNFYHNSLNNAVALVWTDPTLHSRVKTIKHHQTIAIRALKTNQLDQFRGLFGLENWELGAKLEIYGNLTVFFCFRLGYAGYAGRGSALITLIAPAAQAASPAGAHGAVLVCCAAKWRNSLQNRLPGAAQPGSLGKCSDAES